MARRSNCERAKQMLSDIEDDRWQEVIRNAKAIIESQVASSVKSEARRAKLYAESGKVESSRTRKETMREGARIAIQIMGRQLGCG